MAKKPVKETIHAKGYDIGIYTTDFETEFISLTDIARYKSDDSNDVIKNWLRSRETIEFLGLWETLHNPDDMVGHLLIRTLLLNLHHGFRRNLNYTLSRITSG